MNEYIQIALEQAKKAYKKDEIPVGAVVVKNGKVIAKAHNLKEKKRNVIFHAEILAIKKASKKLSNWRLNDCEIYVTLEPCPMCASAIQQSRIKKVVYGVKNNNKETHDIVSQIFNVTDRNASVSEVFFENCPKCLELIKKYFKEKRSEI